MMFWKKEMSVFTKILDGFVNILTQSKMLSLCALLVFLAKACFVKSFSLLCLGNLVKQAFWNDQGFTPKTCFFVKLPNTKTCFPFKRKAFVFFSLLPFWILIIHTLIYVGSSHYMTFSSSSDLQFMLRKVSSVGNLPPLTSFLGIHWQVPH